jgi:hypothetical protein
MTSRASTRLLAGGTCAAHAAMHARLLRLRLARNITVMSRKRSGHLQFQKPVKHARRVALLAAILHPRSACSMDHGVPSYCILRVVFYSAS